MKRALMLAVPLLGCLLTSVGVAEEGQISERGLDQIGLGSLNAVSDLEGMHVRGAAGMAGNPPVLSLWAMLPPQANIPSSVTLPTLPDLSSIPNPPGGPSNPNIPDLPVLVLTMPSQANIPSWVTLPTLPDLGMLVPHRP